MKSSSSDIVAFKRWKNQEMVGEDCEGLDGLEIRNVLREY